MCTHTHTQFQILQVSEQNQLSGEVRQYFADAKSHLCGILQSLLQKLNSADACEITDSVMQDVLLMFKLQTDQSGSVQEAVIMTVGVIVKGEVM